MNAPYAAVKFNKGGNTFEFYGVDGHFHILDHFEWMAPNQYTGDEEDDILPEEVRDCFLVATATWSDMDLEDIADQCEEGYKARLAADEALGV